MLVFVKRLKVNGYFSVAVWASLCCVDTAFAQSASERLFWESVNCQLEAEVRAYLSEYPEGAFKDQAFDCIRENAGKESESLYQPCAEGKGESSVWSLNTPGERPRLAVISMPSIASVAEEVAAIIRTALSQTARIEIVPEVKTEKTEALDLPVLRSMDIDSVVRIDAHAAQEQSGEGGGFYVETRLVDVATGKQVSGFRYSIDRSQTRTLGHKISDEIFERLTGRQVSNLVKRADIIFDGELYNLVISDYDCVNPHLVVESKMPIGPKVVWSGDRRRVAYYFWRGGVKELYVHTLATGAITRYGDMAQAPAWTGMVDE
jgi:hypothetical protein